MPINKKINFIICIALFLIISGCISPKISKLQDTGIAGKEDTADENEFKKDSPKDADKKAAAESASDSPAKEIEAKWNTYHKTILYDFNLTVSGWGDGGSAKGVIVGVTIEPTEKATMADADKKEHGKGLLRIDLNMEQSSWAQAMLHVNLFDEDWSHIVGVEYDIYMPSDGVSSLFATPYMMSEQWKKWSQDEKQTPLIPGKWVTVKCILPVQKNINLEKFTSLGTWIWGKLDNDFKGHIYIDNIKVLSTKALDEKPLLKTLAIKETKDINIKIDSSQYGGEISPYLLSINCGGSIPQVPDKYLKKMGPGGFMRLWGWGVPGDDFNPSKGKYNWEQPDKEIKKIIDTGWEPMVTLGRCPSWMAALDDKGKPKNQGPPRNPQDWADMAADIVKHYNKDLGLNIKYWEIWNEPDIFFWGGTEEEYNELCSAASKAMKKIDPSIKILGGAWASPWAPTSSRLKTLLSKKPDIDYISYHNYLVGSYTTPEKEIFEKVPSASEAPVYKGRKAIKAISKQLGMEEKYKHLDVMMTEACICPDTRFDPRGDTVLFPVYWATALYHYIQQNLECAVYFTLTGKVWGIVYKEPRPIFYLFPLLREKAKFNNAKWLKVDGNSNDLKVLGLRQDDYFNIIIINHTQSNIKYKVNFDLENVKGVDEFKVFRLSDKNNGEELVETVKFNKKFSYESIPYSITVLQGKIKKGTPKAVLKKFEEEPSKAALGFLVTGQYSFSGEKAEFLKKSSGVKIDGDLKEYDNAKPILINNKEKISTGEKADWSGKDDASGKARILWDDNNLYLGIEVTDDKPMINNAPAGADMWNGDCIEFFLGTHHVHISRAEKGEYDYQILLSPKGGTFKPDKAVAFSEPGPGLGTRNSELINSKIVAKKTKKGYIIEARISGENFYEFGGFKSGQELRFDIGIDDADVSERETQIMWNANEHAVWNNPDLWGVAVLK